MEKTPLNSCYLEWDICFRLHPDGWRFEATHPQCQEILTDGEVYRSVETAQSIAKFLICTYQNQAKAMDWLTNLKQNQEISPKAYSDGVQVISGFVSTLSLSDP